MYFPSPADSGGRARTSSQHERGDGLEAFPGIQQEKEKADGAVPCTSESSDVARGADAESAVSSLTGELNKLVIATSTAKSSFCPAIITPTRAPAALGFDNPAALRAGCATGGDSFLGFGDAPPLEEWDHSARGRERAPSSDNVDLGGGCDLGWGALDADIDIAGSRDRGREKEEEEEADESYARDHDAEGR